MLGSFKWAVVVCVITTVVASFYLASQYYLLVRDVESVAHRAQVAADAEDMLAYMTQLRSNMQKHDMTAGHTAVIFKTPSNDLALLYEAVEKIIERLEQTVPLPPTGTAYIQAMDDLRGTIRELEAPSGGYLVVQNLGFFAFYLLWIWPIALAVRYVVREERSYSRYR